MKMYDEKPSYRELAIQYLKDNTLCKGYIDYLVGELEKLDKIEQFVNDSEKLGDFCSNAYIKYIREVLIS